MLHFIKKEKEEKFYFMMSDILSMIKTFNIFKACLKKKVEEEKRKNMKLKQYWNRVKCDLISEYDMLNVHKAMKWNKIYNLPLIYMK